MKRIIITIMLATVLLTACKKNDLNKNNVVQATNAQDALLRYHNSYTALTASLGVPANGPSVNFYVNNVKMNGAANGAALSYTGLFPNVSGGGAFAAAPNGPVNIKAVLNRTTGTPVPSDTIANYNYILGAGKPHSVILIDELPNPTPANPNLMVIQEAIDLPAYGFFRVRLLNLIATNEVYDLFNSTSSTMVATGIQFKNLSPWIDLPMIYTSSVYQIRLSGTTTVMASSVAFSPSNQRTYTFWARGNPAVSGRPRTLVFYTSL